MKFIILALVVGLRVSRAQVRNPPSLTPEIVFLGEISLQNVAGGAQDENATLPNPFDDSDYFSIDEIEPGRGDLDGALDENQNTDMPPPINTFDGIPFGQGLTTIPPDTVGDVGPNHYVQMVNVAFAVFNKTTGAALLQPTPIRVLFSDDPNGCGLTIGDPIVLYDQFADRWILTVLSGRRDPGPFFSCIAVSTTSDPTGSYFRYKVRAQADPNGSRQTVLPDYPKYAVWGDTSYILTTRDFGTTYLGTSVYAFEKSAMISGQGSVPVKQFILNQAVYSFLIGDDLHMLAADVDGPSAPSSNVVPIFSSQDDDLGPNPPGKVDAINVWDLTIDWNNLDNTVLEYAVQLEVPEFSSYIPQPGEDRRDNIEHPVARKFMLKADSCFIASHIANLENMHQC
jgi:hypothetical protein